MVAKHLAMALLGSALICAPAMAQTSSGSGSAGSTMTQMQPGQWRASKLDGLDVYNNNNEKIGDISEMLLDESGKVQAVVVGVGGFLGMGEHDVAIPFDQVKFVNEPRANTAAANNTTGTAGAGGAGAGTAGAGGTSNNMATNNTTMGTTPNTTGSVANNAAGGASSNTGGNNDANRSAPDHAMVNMTKDQLKAMPEFKYNR